MQAACYGKARAGHLMNWQVTGSYTVPILKEAIEKLVFEVVI